MMTEDNIDRISAIVNNWDAGFRFSDGALQPLVPNLFEDISDDGMIGSKTHPSWQEFVTRFFSEIQLKPQELREWAKEVREKHANFEFKGFLKVKGISRDDPRVPILVEAWNVALEQAKAAVLVAEYFGYSFPYGTIEETIEGLIVKQD